MLYEITIPPFLKGLKNFSAILEKASAFGTTKKVEMEVLFNSRLIADQFPLGRQIQIACDTAKLCASRLTTKEAPSHADNEKTFAEFKTRIAETISYLEKFSANDFKGAEDRKITQARWEGKYLMGTEYVLQHALPNFYFHLTTAYSILRTNGVEIGKKDYLGELPFKS